MKKGKKPSARDQIDEDDDIEDVQPLVIKSKGKKGKGKGKAFLEDELQEEEVGGKAAFDLKGLENGMDSVVDKLRVSLKTVVGRVGRVSPDLLDGIRVELDNERRPLAEFAAVTMKDGKDLLVSVYDPSYMKPVSKALYASPLGIAPQEVGDSAFRVPIPRADLDKRQKLVREASEISEQTRVAVRGFRHTGQNEIKSDVEAKFATKDDARSDGKKLDAATKKRTDEVDTVFEKARKILMDE